VIIALYKSTFTIPYHDESQALTLMSADDDFIVVSCR